MSDIEFHPAAKRDKKPTHRARLHNAARCVVETLEARQLLSAAPSQVVTTFPIPTPDSDDYYGSGKIVAGPDGNYWFADTSDNSIGKVTPDGQVTLFPLPTHNVPADDGTGDKTPDDPAPQDIVVGPNGNLWFTENGVDRIGEITTAGKITEFTTPTPDSNPAGIAVGADGNLWFAESATNAIGRVTPAGKFTEFALNNLQTDVDGIVEGADGNIWFIAHDSNYDGMIASITPAGVVKSYSLDSGGNSVDPSALAAGPDGNLWVGTWSSGVERVTPAGAVTLFPFASYEDVTSIEPGSNGNLWLALDSGAQFGSITTAGVISTYSLPSTATDTTNSDISFSDLIQASDGSLWFVDSYNPQVGKLDLTNALLASGNDVTATAGTSTTSTFASFTDFSGSSAATDYTATITLADGSTLPGTIAANSNGGFDVSATNTWTIGYNTLTITITDTRDTTRIATTTATLNATAPQATGTGIDVTATAGQVFSGTVATFTGVALNSLSSYTATIDWGDGHTTTGTITANGSGGFDVAGSTAYAAAGTYTVKTTLSSGGFAYPTPIAFGGPILVHPVGLPVATSGGTTTGIAPTPTVGNTVSLAGGAPLAPIVTRRIDASALAATVATGTSAPMIGIGVDPLPSFFPPYNFGGATATSSATVAAGAMNGVGYSVWASSKSTFSDVVANFTLADPNADLSHFHATVEWNDPGIRNWWYQLSNAPSDGVITPDGNGGFNVSVTNNFTNSGLYHFVVKITDDRLGTGDAAQVGTAYGQLIVDSPNFWLPILYDGGFAATPNATISGNTAAVSAVASNPVLSEHVTAKGITVNTAAGNIFSGGIGSLSGIKSAANLADLHGTIHWGDGTTSPASFTGGKGGHVTVVGSHTFTQPGTQAISVDVSQTLYSNGVATAQYPLHLPAIKSAIKVKSAKKATIITTGGIAITAIARTAFNGPVATFTAPAAAAGVTRTATISWGDGHHSTATLSGTDSLTVTASHVYRKGGKYKVKIHVTQKAAAGSSTKVAKVLASIATSAVVSKV